jgi:hypothetical protein
MNERWMKKAIALSISNVAKGGGPFAPAIRIL